MSELFEHPVDLTITKKIDAGSFGIVFQAVDPQGNTYAIKRIPNYATITKSARSYARKICREVAILSILNENNCDYIVPLTRVYMSANQHDVYLQMPFVDFTLHHIVHTRRMMEEQVKGITYQLLTGIHHCHKRHIMHRDLTLKNILIDQWLYVYIADFGLARAKDTCEEEGTLDVVTLEYRAPELLLGYKSYDFRVDIWSIGCMICEMYLRDRAFPPERRDAPHQLRKIIQNIGAPDLEVVKKYTGGNSNVLHFVQAAIGQLQSENLLPEQPFSDLSQKLRAAGASEDAIDLVTKMLRFDFNERVTAFEALNHPWFVNDPEFGPTTEDSSSSNIDETSSSQMLTTNNNNNNNSMMGERQHSTNSQNYFQRQKSTGGVGSGDENNNNNNNTNNNSSISKMEIVHSDYAIGSSEYDNTNTATYPGGEEVDVVNTKKINYHQHPYNNQDGGRAISKGEYSQLDTTSQQQQQQQNENDDETWNRVNTDGEMISKSMSGNNESSSSQQHQQQIPTTQPHHHHYQKSSLPSSSSVGTTQPHTMMMTKEPSSLPVDADGAPASQQQYQVNITAPSPKNSNNNNNNNQQQKREWQPSVTVSDWKKSLDQIDIMNVNDDCEVPKDISSSSLPSNNNNNNDGVVVVQSCSGMPPPEETNDILKKLQKAKLSELKKFMVSVAKSYTERITREVEINEHAEYVKRTTTATTTTQGQEENNNNNCLNPLADDAAQEDTGEEQEEPQIIYTRDSLNFLQGTYQTQPQSTHQNNNNNNNEMLLENSRSPSD